MTNVDDKVGLFIEKVLASSGESFDDIDDPETKAMIALAIMKMGKS